MNIQTKWFILQSPERYRQLLEIAFKAGEDYGYEKGRHVGYRKGWQARERFDQVQGIPGSIIDAFKED